MKLINKCTSEMATKDENEGRDSSSERKIITLLPKKLVKGEDASYDAVEELDHVLSLPKEEYDIRNVAIMGPFGSGKSSIIRTLMEDFPKNRHYLRISLATLEANGEKDMKEAPNQEEGNKQEGSKGDGNSDNKKESKNNSIEVESLNRKIEYSILQQLVYRERIDKVPHSRISRIVHHTKYELRKYALGAIFAIIAFFIVFEPQFARLEPFYTIFNWGKTANTIVDLIFTGILIYVAFVIFRHLFRTYSGFNVKKIDLCDGAIEMNVEGSIFNKYLDEILYFFQATEYDVVFIEDLDRFNTHSIFLKLRELNHIINESNIVHRQVTFVYAIRDDMFRDDNRTKFFDYIITVIPIINTWNSKDKLKEQLTKLGLADGISDEDLSEIGFFIHDMRILINIVNEFRQYKVRLCDTNRQNLNKTKLLAMIVYKNFYPYDFSLLHHRGGNIFTCINNKFNFMREFLQDHEKRCRKIIEKEKEDTINYIINKEDLRLLLLYRLRNKHNERMVRISIGGRDYKFEDIANDDNLFKSFYESKQVAYKYYASSSSTLSTQTKPNDIIQLADEMNFSKRIAALNKENTEHEKLIEERRKIQSEMESIKSDMYSLRLKDLINKYHLDNLKSYQDIKLTDMQNMFIRLGYIDEDYYDYISYYYENMLTESDKELLLSMKLHRNKTFETKINKIENFVKELKGYMFDNDAILNIQLLDYLAQSREKDNDYFERFMYQLVNSKMFLPFMSSYVTQGIQHAIVFENILERDRDGFWDKITDLSNDEGSKLVATYLRYCGELIEDEQVWLDLNYGFLTYHIDEIGFKRCKILIEQSYFKTLTSENFELLSYVIEKGDYYLDLHNTLVITQTLSHEGDSITEGNLNITRILATKNTNFISKIDSKITTVLNYLNDENKDESEEAMLYIINHKDLPDETKESYLNGQNGHISNITDIRDTSWYDIAVRGNLLLPVWQNVAEYLLSIDEREDYEDRRQDLIRYVEQNATDLSSEQCSVDDISNTNEVFRVLFVYNNDGVSIDKYDILLNSFVSITLDYYDSLKELDEERLHKLISRDKVSFNNDALASINDTRLLAKYLLHYSKEFIANLQSNELYTYNITKEVASDLLLSSAFTYDEKRLILRETPNETKTQKDIADLLLDIYITTKDTDEDMKVLCNILTNAQNEKNRVKLAKMMVEKIDEDDEEEKNSQIDDIIGSLRGSYLDFVNGNVSQLAFSKENFSLMNTLSKKKIIPKCRVERTGRDRYIIFET